MSHSGNLEMSLLGSRQRPKQVGDIGDDVTAYEQKRTEPC